MEEIVLEYLAGEVVAKEELVEDILKLHNYNINRDEAIVLLQIKYGKPKVF